MKKVFCIFLCLCLLAALLAGCFAAEPKETVSNASESKQTVTEETLSSGEGSVLSESALSDNSSVPAEETSYQESFHGILPPIFETWTDDKLEEYQEFWDARGEVYGIFFLNGVEGRYLWTDCAEMEKMVCWADGRGSVPIAEWADDSFSYSRICMSPQERFIKMTMRVDLAEDSSCAFVDSIFSILSEQEKEMDLYRVVTSRYEGADGAAIIESDIPLGRYILLDEGEAESNGVTYHRARAYFLYGDCLLDIYMEYPNREPVWEELLRRISVREYIPAYLAE